MKKSSVFMHNMYINKDKEGGGAVKDMDYWEIFLRAGYGPLSTKNLWITYNMGGSQYMYYTG